ncbi:hypothetical protein EZV62_002911 [Acer yangbiense]|uniref:Protein kinase domain-containing protein n=1 Tax=Acer yangbiense TaxID=1000413 RepID=A0A5C7J0H5_9ROSI|nr:hypothetical protein EZV62_002911 [Acer yangbiense]
MTDRENKGKLELERKWKRERIQKNRAVYWEHWLHWNIKNDREGKEIRGRNHTIEQSNVLLDNDLVTLVSDFGLAKYLSDHLGNTTRGTQSSSMGIKELLVMFPQSTVWAVICPCRETFTAMEFSC